jgi:hypothetical protein
LSDRDVIEFPRICAHTQSDPSGGHEVFTINSRFRGGSCVSDIAREEGYESKYEAECYESCAISEPTKSGCHRPPFSADAAA